MTPAKLRQEIDNIDRQIVKLQLQRWSLKELLRRATSTGYRLDPVTQLPVWYDKKKEAKDKRKRKSKEA